MNQMAVAFERAYERGPTLGKVPRVRTGKIRMDLGDLIGMPATKATETAINQALHMELENRAHEAVHLEIQDTGQVPDRVEMGLEIASYPNGPTTQILPSVDGALFEPTWMNAGKWAWNVTPTVTTNANVRYTWTQTVNLEQPAAFALNDFVDAYENLPAVDWGTYADRRTHFDDHMDWQLRRDGRYEYTITTAATTAYSINGGIGTYDITGLSAGTTFTINGDGIILGANAPLTAEEEEERRKRFFQDTVRSTIRKRMSPDQNRHRKYLAALKSPEEQKARDSLRDMLSEQEWRRYVTNSFVMVKGASGKHYQIFADRRRTAVFEKGIQIATLCIHSDAECPPTDHVINLKLLVELDEPAIWRGSNASWNKGFGPPPEPIGVMVGNPYDVQIADLNLNPYGENLIVDGRLGAAMDNHIANTVPVVLPTWTGLLNVNGAVAQNPDGTYPDMAGYNPETCVAREPVQEGPDDHHRADEVAARVLEEMLNEKLKTPEKGKSLKERSLVEIFKRTGT